MCQRFRSWLQTLLLHPLFSPILEITGLIFVVAALGYAGVQLSDARRAAALGALSTIKQDYFASRMQYYLWFFGGLGGVDPSFDSLSTEEQERKIQEMSDDYFWQMEFRLRSTELLHNIEFACNMYVKDLLDEDAKRLVRQYVEEDVRLLTIWLDYDAETGRLEFAEDESIAWIRPGATLEYQQDYYYTARCMKDMGIQLEDQSWFGPV